MAETMIVDADELFEEDNIPTESEETPSVEVTESETPPEPKEEEVEIEVEGKTPTVDKEQTEVARLRNQIQELQTQLLNLAAQPKEVPVAPKEKPKEEELTRSQLAKIIQENADNPEVILNVMDYIAEQKTKKVKNEAFEELSQSNWEREIAGNANQILAEDKDGYIKSNPNVKDKIDQVKRNLKWDNHPAGDLAAYALIRFSEGLTNEVKEAVKEETPKPNMGKMDRTKVTSPPAQGKKKLTSEQLAMAKKLGVKPETYARFV